jgi:sporulation protein YlmC with PRC-barrel domain
MSKFAFAAALAAVLTGTVYAQQTQTPPTLAPPGQAQQSPGPQDKAQQSQAPQDKAPQDKAQQGEGRQSQSTTTGVATPAQAQVLSAIPNNTTTITSYYKKNVYDRSDVKIGQITDVLVDKDGKIDGFMMAIGGFLGIGEKNVAVPFDAVKVSEKNGDWWDSTKDQVDKAPGFKYDNVKATWVPAA